MLLASSPVVLHRLAPLAWSQSFIQNGGRRSFPESSAQTAAPHRSNPSVRLETRLGCCRISFLLLLFQHPVFQRHQMCCYLLIIQFRIKLAVEPSLRFVFTTLLVLGSLNCPTSTFSQAQLRDMSDKTN